MMDISTPRLRLLPFSPTHLLALYDGVPQFESQTGWIAGVGLREFFVSDDVSPDWIARLREKRDPDPWVYGFAVVDPHSEKGNLVIGAASFKGPPDEEQTVEIAYGIISDYQGRGYATEAATALVRFAIDSGNVRVIRAHTLSTNRASQRVLEKCGFECVGEVVDPEDGPVLRWLRMIT